MVASDNVHITNAVDGSSGHGNLPSAGAVVEQNIAARNARKMLGCKSNLICTLFKAARRDSGFRLPLLDSSLSFHVHE